VLTKDVFHPDELLPAEFGEEEFSAKEGFPDEDGLPENETGDSVSSTCISLFHRCV